MSKVPDTRPYELALLRVVFDPKKAREVAGKGNIKLFHDDAAKAMYRAFLKLHFDRIPVTVDSMRMEMMKDGLVGDADVEGTLVEVMSMPAPEHVSKLIEGLGVLQGRRLMAELLDYLQTPEALKSGMAGAISKINEFTGAIHTVSASKPETLWDTMNRVMERTEPTRVWTVGLGPRLNNRWIIRKGSYTVIGADSGGGKTAMLVQIVKEVARQGTHVGVISIEMTKEELTFRAAAQDAGVDSSRIEDNTITDGERAHIMSVIAQNRTIYERIHVIDDSYVTNEQLPSKYNELITNYGCEVIALDYIQRVGMSGKNNGKVDIVTATSETITTVTKSTGVATIALSTLNEASSAFDGAGKGDGKKKGMNNLKNARQIGHDASTVVILTMQDDPSLPEDEKDIVVQSVKNRKGGYFCVPLRFHGPTQRFHDNGDEIGR